jgi:hypothetical protein
MSASSYEHQFAMRLAMILGRVASGLTLIDPNSISAHRRLGYSHRGAKGR